MLIDGQRVEGEGGQREVFDPATEEVIVTVRDATLDQCDRAIDAVGGLLRLACGATRQSEPNCCDVSLTPSNHGARNS